MISYSKYDNSSASIWAKLSAISYGCIIFTACQLIVLPITQAHEILAILSFIISGVVSTYLAARIQKTGVYTTGIILGLVYGPFWNILYLFYVKNLDLISLILGTPGSDLVFTRLWQSYIATSIAVFIASFASCVIYSLIRNPYQTSCKY